MLMFFIAIWAIHISLGTTVQSALPEQGMYQASPIYTDILNKEQEATWANWPLRLRDHILYPGFYNKGVPELNLCKADENGSPFYMWPLGGRAINYRWSTPGNGMYQYLYLQVNPAVWWISSLAVLLSVCLIVGKVFLPIKDKQIPMHMFVVLSLWLSYMFVMSQLDRVMYLYHYFPPLLFSMVLVAMVLQDIQQFWTVKMNDEYRQNIACGIGVLTVCCYFHFAPFTYYKLISDQAVTNRAWLHLWNLHCVECDRTDAHWESISCEL
jgi:ABC-type Na+ efflux pump permease subunit